jgi:Protein of unknown function (DUF4254)
MMSALELPSAIRAFHDASNRLFFESRQVAPASGPGELWMAAARNHENNMRLWAEEDLARRRQATDAEIVGNKRHIDVFNQARNDAIEQMDDVILLEIGADRLDPQAPLNSETAGSMIDRLSIASLKRFHMALQLLRTDCDESHRLSCQARLDLLQEQTTDLLDCLQRLLHDCASGRARFKTYRQFKMYNDPNLNPWLIKERSQSA